jgi:hypothetical protein
MSYEQARNSHSRIQLSIIGYKRRSQLDQNNNHGKFGQLQRQIVSPNSGYKHCKNTFEQHRKQQKSKIHVPGYQEFLPGGGTQVFRVYEIPFALFPSWIVEQYNLAKHQKDVWIYLEMRQAVWGLPQAGILVIKMLRRKLAPFGYYECVKTLGLWKHETRPLTFTLVVDDFGVKYKSKDDVDHLIASIKSTYKVTKDWTVIDVAASPSIGITSTERLIHQCLDILKRNCRNTITRSLGACRHAHTHQNPKNWRGRANTTGD